MRKFKDVINEISIDDIIQFYEIENHTVKECLEHFNLSQTMFFRLLKYHNFKKSTNAHIEQIRKTKLERYGDANYNNREKAVETSLERYGVENPFQAEEIKEKSKQTMLKRYGVEHIMLLEEMKEKVHVNRDNKKIMKKMRETYYEKTGYDNPAKNPEVARKMVATRLGYENYTDLAKTRQTCQEKYGVDYPCQRPEARVSGSNSKPNLHFAQMLDKYEVEYEREFTLENRSYDFKIGKTLIEINPSVTHNTIWHPFSKEGESRIDKFYHRDKTLLANKHNYHCVHIFDWDNVEKIIQQMFVSKEKIFARNCEVRNVSKIEAVKFLNEHHLQGHAQDSIRLGLYHQDKLVSIMTFGKPRYNKNFDYELIRYASSKAVIGGADRLFKHFIRENKNKSVISYNDRSKFSGDVYEKLGFKLQSKSLSPSKHWHKIDTNEHYTDNLIRQHGFSRIVKKINYTEDTDYETTDNEILLIEHGFVSVFDVGQDTYVYLL